VSSNHFLAEIRATEASLFSSSISTT